MTHIRASKRKQEKRRRVRAQKGIPERGEQFKPQVKPEPTRKRNDEPKKSDVLDAMLKEYHQMMVDADIPVAPLDAIKISYKPYIRAFGYCRYNFDGTFDIWIAQKMQSEGGNRPYTRMVVCHELIHTCSGQYDGHDRKFLERCVQFNKKYGINPNQAMADNIKFLGLPVRHSQVCPKCGRQWDFADPADEKWNLLKTYYSNATCQYCGTKYEVVENAG